MARVRELFQTLCSFARRRSVHSRQFLAESSAPAPAAAEGGIADDLHVVKSPIVGTFYAAPSPEADPFVKVGAKVNEGTVLGIIEAMKLMNEIESDVAGEVVKVFIENGSPVEYGEPLFGIRASQEKEVKLLAGTGI